MYSTKDIKVVVACLPRVDAGVKKLFFNILNDYCQRFDVVVWWNKPTVNICMVEYNDDDPKAGVTIHSEEVNKIHVQVRDPYLNDWEDNPYVNSTFISVLCHELIHVCQTLTCRKGFKVKGASFDKSNPLEAYYFDPEEVEARCLAEFYGNLYGNNLTS